LSSGFVRYVVVISLSRLIFNHLDLISFWALDIISRFLVITKRHLLQPAPNGIPKKKDRKKEPHPSNQP
jgi:hypothetical protein